MRPFNPRPNSKGKGNGGKPSGYSPDLDIIAYEVCLLAGTNEKLGEMFGVTAQTIRAWSRKYPSFRASIKRGKIEADSKIAGAMHMCAVGYYKEIEVISNGKVIKVNKWFEPQVSAAKMLLASRQSEHYGDTTLRLNITNNNLNVTNDDTVRVQASTLNLEQLRRISNGTSVELDTEVNETIDMQEDDIDETE